MSTSTRIRSVIDGYDVLAVGAPGINNGAGGVFIFEAAADGTGTFAFARSFLLDVDFCSLSGLSAVDFGLGSTLVAGNFNGDVSGITAVDL